MTVGGLVGFGFSFALPPVLVFLPVNEFDFPSDSGQAGMTASEARPESVGRRIPDKP